MNISAINASPLKPQSFGNLEPETDNASKFSLEDQELDSFIQRADNAYSAVAESNIKKPLTVIASVALAGLTAFKTGSAIVGKVASYPVFEKFINAEVSNPKYFENGIRKVVNIANDKVSKIAQKGKIAKFASSVYGKAEGALRNGYKYITGLGTTKYENLPAQLGLKKLQNIGGVAATAVILPSVCNKDSDNDGVTDISQKDRNAYLGTRNVIEKGKNIFAKAIELLT